MIYLLVIFRREQTANYYIGALAVTYFRFWCLRYHQTDYRALREQ